MSEGPDGNGQNDMLDLAFDPTGGSCLPPPLRPPALSQAQLLAAIELGFSNKYLPAEVAGALGNGGGGGANPYYSSNNSDYGSTFSSGDYSQQQGNHQQQHQYPSPGDFIDGQGHRGQRFVGNKEDQGLLPPLRRPHVNEIPPDVLAVLLKTARFEEIIGPLQRRQIQPHSNPDLLTGTGSPGDHARMSGRNMNNQNQMSNCQQQNLDRSYAGGPPQHQQRASPVTHNADRNYANSPPQHNQMAPTGTPNSDRIYANSPPQHNQMTPTGTPNSDRNYANSPPQHNQRAPTASPHSDRNYTGTPPGQRAPVATANSAQQQRFNSPSQSHSSPRGTPFSVNAKEFRPSMPMAQRQQQQMMDMGMMNSQEEAELAQAVAQFQFESQTGGQGDYDPNSFSSQMVGEDNSDCILSIVTDSFSDLTTHPANFNRCAKAVTEVLRQYLVDADTLGVVVTLLIEQSISNPNFCYSGARLCQVLHKKGIAVGEAKFLKVFFARLQEEFTICVDNLQNPDITARARRVLMFFGELFVNVRIESAGGKQVPYKVLGYGLLEIMQKLVKSEASHDNVKIIFQVLKLVGWELENYPDPKIKSEFEKTMKDLSYISVSNVKPQTKLLLDTLFELKNKKWNREEHLEDGSQTPSESSNTSNVSGTHSNIYELPESDDDDFDESCLMLDDEPEEVQQAYEEFLKMQKNKK